MVVAVRSIAALAALLASLAAAGPAVHQPLFKSGIEIVPVDVLVTRDERPVTGLVQSDFELFDNGVRQRIDDLLAGADPIDVMLALDTSASLDKTELAQLADAVRSAIEHLKPGDRAGLLTFAEELSQLVPLTERHDVLRASVDRLKTAGATALVDAAYAALLSTRAKGRRSLALLFTDGLDTWSWLEPAWVLDVAKRSETVVYTVELRDATPPSVWMPGTRSRLDQREYYRGATRFLDDLAEATGGRRLDAGDIARLRSVLETVIDEFRQRYVLLYTPAGVAQDGWHELEVRVKKRRLTVRARPGYSR